MKQGTLYAGRIKQAFSRLKRAAAAPPPSGPDDPLRRLAIGVLGVRDGEATATKALNRLLDSFVDWNEIRVSTAAEAQAAIGNTLSDGAARCERLRTVLQSVFDKVNLLSLDHLKSMGRREARQFLESLDGVDEYAAACVVLWSLGGHAIPVDDKLWQTLRDAELVNPEASRAEVQAFLERHISAADAKLFCQIAGDRKALGDAAVRGKSRDASRSSKTSGAARKKSKPKRVTKKS